MSDGTCMTDQPISDPFLINQIGPMHPYTTRDGRRAWIFVEGKDLKGNKVYGVKLTAIDEEPSFDLTEDLFTYREDGKVYCKPHDENPDDIVSYEKSN